MPRADEEYQAEIDSIGAKRLARAAKGMPREEKMNAVSLPST